MLKLLRLAGAILVLALSHLATPAKAVQSTGCMPVTGLVSGLQLSENINAAIAALISTNSGGVAPVTDCSGVSILGQQWFDTSLATPAWRLWDGAQVTPTGYFDLTNHLWLPVIGGGVASVASSATTDLCDYGGSLLPQNYITLTGATAITSFGSSCQIGQIKYLNFSGAITLTYGSSAILTPTSQSIAAQSGDQATLVYLGGGVWRVREFQSAAGARLYSGTTVTFASNAYTVSATTPSGYSLSPGSRITFIAPASNTGAATLDVNSTGAIAIKKLQGGSVVALVGGEIQSGGVTDAFYDGTQFQLLSPAPAGVPSGAVMAFYLSSCPAGWLPANGSNSTINLVGYFIRGLDTAGAVDPTARTLGSIEAHALQQHEHSAVTPGYVGSELFVVDDGSGGGLSMAIGAFQYSIGNVTGANTSSETRPVNVALLYCQKE